MASSIQVIRPIFFNVYHPEVFNTYINIQWCISQKQQNFIKFIIVLGQHASILIKSSGPSKIQNLTVLEGPEGNSIRIETRCPNTIINIIKFCCVWLIHHCMFISDQCWVWTADITIRTAWSNTSQREVTVERGWRGKWHSLVKQMVVRCRTSVELVRSGSGGGPAQRKTDLNLIGYSREVEQKGRGSCWHRLPSGDSDALDTGTWPTPQHEGFCVYLQRGP